MAEQRFVAAVK